METNNNNENGLRQKAKAILDSRGMQPENAPEDVKSMLEELSIHQIELEMQNDELRKSQQVLEKEKEKYRQLYDYAPVAYITLNHTGNIIDLNYEAARLFGKAREVFNYNSIFPFLHEDSKTEFRKLLQDALHIKHRTKGGITFLDNTGGPIYTKVNSLAYEDSHTGEQLVRLTITDIVEEKKQQIQELEKQEIKYSEIFNNSKDAIFLFGYKNNGAPDHFIEVNKQGISLMECDYETLLEKSPTDLAFNPNFGYIKRAAKALDTKDSVLFEVFHHTKNGDKLPVEIDANTFEIYGHKYGLVVVRDVRERKKSEAKIRENERKYSLLAEHINDTILLTDLDFNLLYVSPSIEKLTGYTQEEYLNLSVEEGLTPQSLKIFKKEQQNFKELMNRGNVNYQDFQNNLELERYHKDGFVINIEISQSFLIEQNQPTGIIAVVRDISARKRAENKIKETNARLQLAMEVGNLGWWDWDFENDELITADKKPEMLGYDPAKEKLSAYDYTKIIHPDDYDKAMNAMRQHLEGKAEHYKIENRLRMKNGEYKWLYDVGRIVERTEDGKPKRLMGVIFDITTRKNNELTIKKQNEDLKELNITKDKFFSIIAHDLKNPFNTIIGFSNELLKNHSQLDNAAREKLIRAVHESAKQNFSLLENLLVWSRMQSNRMPFNPENITISELIAENAALFQGTAQKKNISLIINTKNETECWVNADREMINTVLRNLISNAIKYTPEGGTIEIGCDKADHKAVKTYVKDSGMGMKQETVPKLFQIEETFTTPGTAKEQGTGLGLILVKEFIDKNNGEIQIESQPGRGTTIAFTLKSVQTKSGYQQNCFGSYQNLYTKITQNTEAFKLFYDEIVPHHKECYKSYSSRKVVSFSEEILHFADKYKIDELRQFGTRIKSSIKQFDVNQLNICFGEFDELVSFIEKHSKY